MIFSLPNPIPYSVKDVDQLQRFIKKYQIIPYYGTEENASHSFLDLLTTLTTLSPTFTGVASDLAWYTFGQNVSIVGRSRPGLASEITELDYNEQVRFDDYLAGLNIRLVKILKLCHELDYHLNVTGNAYLHIRRINVGGTTRYEMSVEHYKHCAYLVSQDIGEQFLIVSKFLGDDQRMQKFPPLVLRATQMDENIKWTSIGRGVEDAIIHLKRGTYSDESDYYARPHIISVLTWLYTDFQIGNLASKVAATELVSKMLLAFQAQDPNTLPDDDPVQVEYNGNGKIGKQEVDMFKRNMLTLKELTSNLGRHPSQLGTGEAAAVFAGVEYPYGSVPPTPIPLELNRDTKHQVFQYDSAKTAICSALRWSPELIAARPTTTTLGGNLLYDIFTMRNVTTINPRQTYFEDFWNNIFAQVLEREGSSDFRNYGIKFPEVITQMIEQLKGDTASVGQVTDSNNPAAAINRTQDAANANDPAGRN